MTEPIAKPSRDDPVVAAASEWIGGPYGAYGQRERASWWTPVRVALAVACFVMALGYVVDGPCRADGWETRSDRELWTSMCYSDVAFLYRESGIAGGGLVYRDIVLDYPVLTSAAIRVSAWAVRDLEDLAGGTALSITDESVTFFDVTALLLGLAALLVVIATARTVPRRPWDGMLVAGSPVLLLASTINWDLLGVALMSLAILAWERQRGLIAGAMLGLATAAELYPALLLIAMLLVTVRQPGKEAVRRFAYAAPAALVTWCAVNLPVALWAPEEWRTYFTSFADRDIDIGSTWYAVELLGGGELTVTGNVLLSAGAVVVVGAVVVLGYLADEPPRLAQVAFLLVAGYLLIAKTWQPQDALWLLPLAVLARPRWRDVLIWQAAEVAYFAVVWWFLGGVFTDENIIWSDLYAVAVMVRAAAVVWFAGLVARDMLQPELDPVRPYLPIRSRSTTPQAAASQ